MQTVVYFDLLNQPGSGFLWQNILVIVFVVVFAALLYAYTIISNDPVYKKQKNLIIILFIGTIAFEIADIWQQRQQANECRSWRQNGDYRITEGRVSHFRQSHSK